MATVDPSIASAPAIVVPKSGVTLNQYRDWVYSHQLPDAGKFTFIAGTLIIELDPRNPTVMLPPSGMSLDDYRRWADSDEFPQRGHVAFINSRLFIDMSPERIDLHTKIKGEITFVLTGLVKRGQLGEFFPDGTWITNRDAGVSNEPDAAFATWDTLKSGKLAPPPASAGDRYTELIGAPDWICEIVSDASVEKDTQLLMKAYHHDGISEYWLIDARGEEIEFQLLVWNQTAYAQAEIRDGWAYSPVFQQEFRLTRHRSPLGRWQYDLQHRDAA